MKINGKYYTFVKGDDGKSGRKRLQELAKKYREKGYSARVVEKGWGAWKGMKFRTKYYELWIRK